MNDKKEVLKGYAWGQVVALAALAFAASSFTSDPVRSFGALFFGWALFASNALIIAFAAFMLMRQADGGGSQSLGSRIVFLGMKAIWVALGVYIGLVVLKLPGGLFVAGAAAGLAAFALSSFWQARRTPLSEKS